MRWTVVSLVRQSGRTAADNVWCEKLATTCSVMASVVNYLKYIQTILYFVFEINYKSILYFAFKYKNLYLSILNT